MEVSALKYSGGIGLHGRSRLLRLQSDERLVSLLRKGNNHAFEILVSRYEVRLLAFCRHLLGSREDAEDVLQEVLTAAFNAILADNRTINVRPWLYRIARNRSLNHLRRIQAIGVDTMDFQLSEHGATTADKVHEREAFRLLVGDIHELPETQKTALVLREMDALSYEQIAEAMETTVPSVKSLLVRARVSLAEAAEARLLSCDEVRMELGEVAEGLRRRPTPLVRRHLRQCKRCTNFRTELKHTNKALAALLPVGPVVLLKKLLIAHLGHSAGAGSGATAAGSGAAGAAGVSAAGVGAAGAGATGAGAAAGGVLAGSSALAGSGGFVSAGIGALAGKAAAGLAAAALVTGAAVEVDHGTPVAHHPVHHAVTVASVPAASSPAEQASVAPVYTRPEPRSTARTHAPARPGDRSRKSKIAAGAKSATASVTTTSTPTKLAAASGTKATINQPRNVKATPTGRTQNQSDATVLAPGTTTGASPTPEPTNTTTSGSSTTPTTTQPGSGTGTTGGTGTTTPTGTGTGTPTGTGTGTPTGTGTGTPTGTGTGTPTGTGTGTTTGTPTPVPGTGTTPGTPTVPGTTTPVLPPDVHTPGTVQQTDAALRARARAAAAAARAAELASRPEARGTTKLTGRSTHHRTGAHSGS
jgi:RNA polymerase sigma factor (sigma-70 family)